MFCFLGYGGGETAGPNYRPKSLLNPLTRVERGLMFRATYFRDRPRWRQRVMKVVNSLKSMKDRHKECRIVRRKGRLYVINKRNPRFKARQG